MLQKYKSVLLVAGISSLLSCSKVDDYLLGKDNTPKPEALQAIDSKVKMSEKWSVSAGSSQKSANYLKLKPVIIDGTIYTADSSGVVDAVNRKTGQILWSKKLDSAIVSGPAISQGYLVVGTDASKIIALKLSDGKELWQGNVSGEVLSKPVIAHDKVIAKTIDGNLFAFKLSTGEKLWVSEHGAPSLILKASSSPVIINNELALVGYSDGRMDAVDLQTGRVVWQRSIAYANGASDVERLVDIDADPIIQGKTVILGSYQGYVGALSLENGEFIWKKPASIYKNMVVSGNTLYMTDSDDIVWSINKQTGVVNWKQVALKARGLTEPVIMGERVVVGDRTGMLHILSAKNGEFISRASLGSAITVAPGVAGKNIYVMTANGKLSRFSVS